MKIVTWMIVTSVLLQVYLLTGYYQGSADTTDSIVERTCTVNVRVIRVSSPADCQMNTSTIFTESLGASLRLMPATKLSVSLSMYTKRKYVDSMEAGRNYARPYLVSRSS
ncbi:uncharacterized protein HD556DRAFT_1040376 [Suillus plorans]|uniref:Uncharacterized protein n=1 Tax=Suillus plorans TaxID=116603 RepID=A0A9P7J2W2_9AGAM|nr:uncharacterized protein HD556DRAFT_1040376 [Suillus plorans]KAG1800464.1 hypothetical protein HD556DRAFT_1040376 [Suillus plorans]